MLQYGNIIYFTIKRYYFYLLFENDKNVGI